jgi:hypothetical protein
MRRRFDNRRRDSDISGTAGQWIKEGKGAIKWTQLSCRTFAANAVRLQLYALTYNLGNFLRKAPRKVPASGIAPRPCGNAGKAPTFTSSLLFIRGIPG